MHIIIRNYMNGIFDRKSINLISFTFIVVYKRQLKISLRNHCPSYNKSNECNNNNDFLILCVENILTN